MQRFSALAYCWDFPLTIRASQASKNTNCTADRSSWVMKAVSNVSKLPDHLDSVSWSQV